jgi:hypothetical protein
VADIGYGGRCFDGTPDEGCAARGALRVLAALQRLAEEASLGRVETTTAGAAAGLRHGGGPAARSRVARRSQRSAAA